MDLRAVKPMFGVRGKIGVRIIGVRVKTAHRPQLLAILLKAVLMFGVRVKTDLNSIARSCGFAIFTLTPILLVLASCGGPESPAAGPDKSAGNVATENVAPQNAATNDTGTAKPAARTAPPSVSYAQYPSAGKLAPPAGTLTNPLNADPAAAQQGQMLFAAMNCDGCHGGGAVGFVGPSLVDGRWRYGGEDGALFHSIFYGRPRGMPAYGGLLDEATVWQLITYLRRNPCRAWCRRWRGSRASWEGRRSPPFND